MKIETDSKVLQKQQIVLAHLGYYSGKLDGIWSLDTITAKRKFEQSGKFNPGIPNQGLPFVSGKPFPKGVFADPMVKNTITCKGLTAEVVNDLIQKRGEHTGNTIATDTKKVEVEVEEVIPMAAPKVEEKVVVDEKVPMDAPKTEQKQEQRPKHKSNQNPRHRHN